MDKQYDKTDIESIIEYASKAKNHAISDIISSSSKVSKKDKGGVGNLIQEDYFGIPRNSSSEPDFKEAELELKTFGFWNNEKGSRADQRLSLSAIDFMEYESEVPFEESHLYHKCRNMLFMAYLLELGRARIDSEIKYVRLFELDKIVESDLKQIESDYYLITEKIRNGKAANLSEGDTEFLGAARTGSKNSKVQKAPGDIEALPRRFALKHSYMSHLVREYLIPERDFSLPIKKRNQIVVPKGMVFESWVDRIESIYVGKKIEQIVKYKKIQSLIESVDLGNKSAVSRVGLAMIGAKSNQDPYLKKTNTVVKSVRINELGITMEDNPFPTFALSDVESKWEDSQMFSYLSERRFLLQVFVADGNDYVYTGHTVLKFTPEQLDVLVKGIWEEFQKRVAEGLCFFLDVDKSGRPKVRNSIQGKVDGQIGLIKLHVWDIVYDLDVNHISAKTPRAQKFIEDHTVNGRFQLKIENKDKYGDVLPNGDVIPKQSFWLKKEYILEFLQENAPELLKYEKQ